MTLRILYTAFLHSFIPLQQVETTLERKMATLESTVKELLRRQADTAEVTWKHEVSP